MFGAPLPIFSGRTTPTLGAPTAFVVRDTVDRDTTTMSHNSATGNVLVRMVARRNSSGSTVAATWGGSAVTQRSKATGALVTSAIAWIGLCKAGPTGLNNMVMTNSSVRNIAIWIQDVANIPDQPIGETGISPVDDTSMTTVAATIGITNASSLAVAVGGFVNGGADPFTISGAWTKSEANTGNFVGDLCAVFAQLDPSVAGDETLTLTGSVADDQRALAILELLPI